MKQKLVLPVVLSFSIMVLAACASTGHHQQREPNQSDESQSTDALTYTPRDQHQAIINALQLCSSTVDIVNYHLSDPNVVTAIKAAHDHGVQIRIILDAGTLKENATARSIMSDLQNHVSAKSETPKILVKSSSTAFSITHQKSLVADNHVAFITTMNLVTTSGVTRDFGIITADTDIINEMNSVFTADWQNADNNGKNTPELPSGSHLIWSPVNSRDGLIRVINGAAQTLDVDVENFGDQEVQAALISKASKVKIRILTPGCISGGEPLRNRPYLQAMSNAGITNRVIPANVTEAAPYMHGKMIVADGQTFYLGSENYSYNSLSSARELGIVLQNSGIAQQLEGTFEADWAVALDPAAVTQQNCSDATGPYSPHP